MIYFDNAATTMIHPEVVETYQEVAKKIIGNPSSLHDLGTQASGLLRASRQQIAGLLSVSADEIIFTSGGTEGDNWALKGVAFEKKKYGNHIIVSSIEHPAVKNTADWLSNQGFEVDLAPVDSRGIVQVDRLSQLIREDTILVSIMAVNNEIGSIQPIPEIAALLHERPTISFHVDAVQAVGKVAVSYFLPDRVDFATLSAHKFHGPRGVGILIVRAGKKLSPLLHGGGQEDNLRSTTENVAGIAATSKALRLALENVEDKLDHVLKMKMLLFNELKTYKGLHLFSQLDKFVPNILTFGIRGIRGEVLVHAFEEKETYLSTTSACSSKKNAAASTLMAMKISSEVATTAVRISLDPENTVMEIREFLDQFKGIYARFLG